MGTKLSRFFSLLLFATTWCCFSEAKTRIWTGKTVERPVLVGAFNIQNLGGSKMGNKVVMDIIKKVLLRYDLILIQEIVTLNRELITNLVDDINKLHNEENSFYNITISDRLGRGTAKEQYAFLYRSDKFQLVSAVVYPNDEDAFMRPPYIAKFATPTLRDMEYLLAIGIHTQPKNAANETSALADVYDFAAKNFKVKDAIIMGDMNAGCANVRVSDWDGIDLWKREEFTWLITHDFDTTLSLNCCPYDRIVIAGENMGDAVMWETVNAFKFRDEYGISTETALAVSDHWPVEVKLRGGSSPEARSSLKPSLCLTVHDSRTQGISLQLFPQKKTMGFEITRTETTLELYAEMEDSTKLLDSFQKLQTKYQQLISTETMDAMRYKVEHGALSDVTSHTDVESELSSILVHFDMEEKTTTCHFCVATTIN